MKPLHTIPIAERPAHGTLFSKLLFPLLFNLGQIGIHLAQLIALPLLLIPVHGQRLFDDAISWTKDGYGRLCG
jgi:lysocardiolipin and lysophospholipid acyltransferase